MYCRPTSDVTSLIVVTSPVCISDVTFITTVFDVSVYNIYIELNAPGMPTYVRTRTFPDSVIVSWLPPDDTTVIRGYMVGYGEGVPDVNWQYVEAARKNVTIKNLSRRIIIS